jgi:hypothetical protein
LQVVDKRFALFYDLLSYESARVYKYRSYFQEAEGQPIRSSVFRKALRDDSSARFIPRSELALDLDRVMTAFFQRLTGDEDPDLLEICFVDTAESRHADAQLARISEDIIKRIRDLDTSDAAALTALIERAALVRRHEFVVVVGTKGAGKSTFIARFFRHVLPRRLSKECVVLKVDVGDSSGDTNRVVAWLDQALLAEVETTLYGDDYPDFEELEGIFYDAYTRLKKGPWAELYKFNHTQFQIDFGKWVEELRSQKPNEYLHGLLRHIVRSRRKLPVVVLDNADHFDIEFQEKVYQYARSIYEATVTLVILPITDRTSWQLSRHGALQSFEHEAFFLPTPPTDRVIKKRIEFLERRISEEREKPEGRYFVRQGISLSISDLIAFTVICHEHGTTC